MSGPPKFPKEGPKAILGLVAIYALFVCFGWTAVTPFGPDSRRVLRYPASLSPQENHSISDAIDSDSSEEPASYDGETIDLSGLTQKRDSALTHSLKAFSKALAFREAETPGSLALFSKLLDAASADPSFAQKIINKVFEGEEPDEKARLTKELTAILQQKDKGVSLLKKKLTSLSRVGALVESNTPVPPDPDKSSTVTQKNSVDSLATVGLLAFLLNSRNDEKASDSESSRHENKPDFANNNFNPSTFFHRSRHRFDSSPDESSQESQRPADATHSRNSAPVPENTQTNSHEKKKTSEKDTKDSFQLPPAKTQIDSSTDSPKKSATKISATSPVTPLSQVQTAKQIPNSVPTAIPGIIPQALPDTASIVPGASLPSLSSSIDNSMGTNLMDNSYYGGFGGYGGAMGAMGTMDPNGLDPSIDPFKSIGMLPAEPFDSPIPTYTLETTSGLDEDGDYDPGGTGDEGGDPPSRNAMTPQYAQTFVLPSAEDSRPKALGLMAYVGYEVSELCDTAQSKVALCQRRTMQIGQRSSLFTKQAWKEILRRFSLARKIIN